MAVDFQNVYCYNVSFYSSVVLADVLEHNCNPAGENELSFVVATGFFLFLCDSGFQRAFDRPSYIEGKQCGRWLLIFLTKCGC